MENDIKTIEQVIELIKKLLEPLETKLNLEKGFFFKITDEDDWSFIIKLHALIEAAVSHLLTDVLGREELSDVFAELEMSNKKRGKLAFVRALNLLDEDDRRFISKLSELR